MLKNLYFFNYINATLLKYENKKKNNCKIKNLLF